MDTHIVDNTILDIEPSLRRRLDAEIEFLKEQNKKNKGNDGEVPPEQLVAFAEDPKTAWHHKFDWDNTSAGHKHRLLQARQYLRVFVTVIPGTSTITKKYVSLSTHRNKNSGYLDISTVLSKPNLREQLLKDAYREMEIFMAKYAGLQELLKVFMAMKRVRRQIGKTKVGSI